MNFGTFLSGPAKRTVGARDSCEKTTAMVVAETALHIAICGGGTVITPLYRDADRLHCRTGGGVLFAWLSARLGWPGKPLPRRRIGLNDIEMVKTNGTGNLLRNTNTVSGQW